MIAFHPLVHLQQTIGNRAVGRFVKAQLIVSKPGDKYEEEADHVAEKVMQMPDSQVQRHAEEEKELRRQSTEEKKKEETVTSKEMSGHTHTVAPKVQTNIQNMRGKGKPLPSSVRNFFEPRFEYVF